MTTTPPTGPIYQALFAKLESVSFAPALGASVLTTWGDVSRRVKHFRNVPRENQPAAYQAEHKEVWQPKHTIALPHRRILQVMWIVYYRTDGGLVGAVIKDQIVDAITQALAPDRTEANLLTLGGLVTYCRIEGDIWCETGDLDDQAMLTVPIVIMAP